MLDPSIEQLPCIAVLTLIASSYAVCVARLAGLA